MPRASPSLEHWKDGIMEQGVKLSYLPLFRTTSKGEKMRKRQILNTNQHYSGIPSFHADGINRFLPKEISSQ
jgi:hypothetical protein